MCNSLGDYRFTSSSFIQQSYFFSRLLQIPLPHFHFLSEPNTSSVISMLPLIPHNPLQCHFLCSFTSPCFSMLHLWKQRSERVWRENTCHEQAVELYWSVSQTSGRKYRHSLIGLSSLTNVENQSQILRANRCFTLELKWSPCRHTNSDPT